MSKLIVVGADPGGTSGVCAGAVPEETIFGDMPYQGIEILFYDEFDDAEEGLHAWNIVNVCYQMSELNHCDRIPLVTEQFGLRKFIRGPDLLSPERINALIKEEVRRASFSIPIFYQTPAGAKEAVTNQRLKDWDLYIRKGGKEHARDAQRHMVHFFRRAKKSETLREEAWGKR
jgi:hypothetical protein